jgi:hypothetical protein
MYAGVLGWSPGVVGFNPGVVGFAAGVTGIMLSLVGDRGAIGVTGFANDRFPMPSPEGATGSKGVPKLVAWVISFSWFSWVSSKASSFATFHASPLRDDD